MSDLLDRRVTRKDVLSASLAGGVLLATGGLLGCGDDSKSSAGATAAASAPRRGGALRVGVVGATTDTLDAHIGSSEANTLYTKALYDPLYIFDHDYRPQPAVAEELIPSADAKTWTVRLRDGVTFHDGRPVTAEDVMFTLDRILDPRNGATAALLLGSIDRKRMRKRDERTVELQLKYPDVTLTESFAKASTGVIPVGYDPKRPIGCGPFKVTGFDPSRRAAFERFDDYYRTGKPYLDELVFVVFKDPTAFFNAINSGTVDAAGRLGAEQVALAKQNPQLRVVRSPTSSMDPIVMRCSEGPFKDVRVRQAMRELVDREQFVSQVYSGFARVGNDLPAIDDAMYAHDIPQREPDLDKARSLLKAAGAEGLQVTFDVRPDGVFLVKSAEVFAQQAKEIGVDVKINNVSDVGQFYSKYFGNTNLQSDYYFSTTLWTAVAYGLLPTSPYNTAHWENAEAARLFAQARGTLAEGKRRELLADAQQIFWEDSGWIVTGFPDSHDALSTRFTGLVPDPSGGGVNGGRFEEIGLAS